MNSGYVKVSNELIRDTQLAPSTKRVFITMLAYSNRKGTMRKTLEEISRLSRCSAATVCKALKELQELQLVHKVRTYRELYNVPGKVYATNVYQINRAAYSQKHFTMIPRSILGKAITHATFVVALYLFAATGMDGRAFPSIRCLAKDALLAVSTVLLALASLRKCQEIIRLHCRRKNGSYACNSYYITTQVRPASLHSAPKSHCKFSKSQPGSQAFMYMGGVTNFIGRLVRT